MTKRIDKPLSSELLRIYSIKMCRERSRRGHDQKLRGLLREIRITVPSIECGRTFYLPSTSSPIVFIPAFATIYLRYQSLDRLDQNIEQALTTSSPPSSATTRSTIPFTSDSLETSATTMAQRLPLSRISFSRVRRPWSRWPRSLTATSNPSVARRSAIALPIPRDDPVTSAIPQDIGF